MIKIVDYNKEIRETITQLISDKKLYPILGSGFTKGCKAKNGTVPTGKEMIEYMAKFLAKVYNKSETEYESRSFSELCTLYDKKSSTNEKFDYFSSNFTEVELEDIKKRFLSLFSQYIYTLNIDDAIEHNCNQFNVLLPNTEIFDGYIEQYTTVFKLHGDVNYYLKNIENESVIFNKKEYVESIKKNGKMLAKLTEDFADKNIIFIGCSLNDEPDILSIVSEATKRRLAESQAYYLTSDDIDEEREDLLEEYGITTIIKIKDYTAFFGDIISNTSFNNKGSDFFDAYYEPEFLRLAKSDVSIDMLLNSNSIVPSPFEGKIYLPPFYILRDVINDVLTSLKNHSPIHIIYGNRISGKTLFLVGLLNSIQDKSGFYFPSNIKISDERINSLLEKKNCIFMFDTNTLNAKQLQALIRLKNKIVCNNNYLVLTINTSDRNGIDLISTTEKYGFTKIKNVFSDNEIEQLNRNLQICNLPTFINREIVGEFRKVSIPRTILDNLYIIYEHFPTNRKLPEFLTLSKNLSVKKIALLIILATNKEISSYELSYYNLREEAISLAKDFPFLFEVRYYSYILPLYDSVYKIMTNSRYYILKYLGDFSKVKNKYKCISDSYKYIYTCIKENEVSYDVPRKMLEYLKFDVLNDIFYKNNNSTTDFIKYVYEIFEEELNISPQFKHQRAKSILWRCQDDLLSMQESAKYIELARFDTESLIKSNNNDKLRISLEHIKYTQSIIYGRICALEKYTNSDNIKRAIRCYLEALTSANNELELEEIRKKKTYKYIYVDLKSLIDYVKSNAGKFADIMNECDILSKLLTNPVPVCL